MAPILTNPENTKHRLDLLIVPYSIKIILESMGMHVRLSMIMHVILFVVMKDCKHRFIISYNCNKLLLQRDQGL